MSNLIERKMAASRLSPMRDFAQLQDSFNRLFSEFASLRKSGGMPEFNFSPSCDISEEGNNYVMKFDLPGVTRDQVKVEAENDQLTIWAERKEEKKTESKKKYLSEVCYGSYSRSFTMPGPIDEKKIDAKFENGVLTVTMPKTEQSKAKQIPIH